MDNIMRRTMVWCVLLAGGITVCAQTPSPLESASLTVTGDIPAALRLTAADLAQLPRETVTIAEQNGSNMEYSGVLLREILIKAGAPTGSSLRGKALASYVLATASDGYQVVFTLAEMDPMFAGERILVVDQRDQKPLPTSQGPLRLVCPGDKEGARSVRMLERIAIVRLGK
jgi:DMSO/TMAO reductase YedYZ molybdopterin-dependent catalytic subunit